MAQSVIMRTDGAEEGVPMRIALRGRELWVS
jgi:hypothetical protein